MVERRGGVSAWSQRRLWSTYSRCYDGLLDLIPYQRLVQMVVEAVEPRPGMDVVDLGCGTGNALAALLAQQPDLSVTGVDSSGDMLQVARRKLDGSSADLLHCDVLDWLRAAPSNSVDRVVSVNVLYTMHAADREVFWEESLRVLRPSGRIVVVTTDRAGVGPVIREHTAERSFLSSITPRLAAVLVMNMVIWLMESRKVFDPASVEVLSAEAVVAGGGVVRVQRCYGGEVDGVDILMVVEPTVDLAGATEDLGMIGPEHHADATPSEVER